jgi:diguanylate cyclase (GGDEF)-like protein/PAS domain S-box-containing protein
VEIIFNTSPDASLIVRLKDRIIINMNDKFTALTGFTREEIVGKSSLDLRIWKNPEDRHRVAEIMNQKGFCENVEVEFLRKDFRPLVGMISAKVVQLQKIPHIVTFTRDITDRKQAEEALRASEARYRAVAYSASDAIISANSLGTIVNWNRGAEHMFGYTVVEVSGQSVSQLMPERYRDLHLAGMNRMRSGENSRIVGKTLELEGLHKNGSEFPIELSLSQWETGEGRFYTAIIRDTTERRHYQDRLEYFASHDSLTSLLNRHALEEHLSRMIAKARRGGKGCLLYMDLDNFKDVNDSVGHSAGDEILIHLTNRFKAELRTEDIIFRLGGDEFAVLFDGVDLAEAWPAAERLRRGVESHPFEAGGRIFSLSLSSGLIRIDGKLETDPLLSQADTAMYQAKAQGKNQVVTYQKED